MPALAKKKRLQEICQKGRSNFFDFCNIVTKDDGLEPFADFQKLICNRIDDQLKTCPRGIREMFSVPPGYGKSTLLSQLLVAYLLGLDPKNKILLISYASDLSKRNARYAKSIMEKPIYKLMFPDTQLVGIKDNPPFETTQGGGIRAMGRGGSITGFRADFILIDDILKGPEEAASDAVINSLHEWYPTVPNTRLKPGGGIIILATRWTKRDLIGHLSAQSKRWNYINLEALCTDKEKDPLHREVGEALWPSYKPAEDIEEIRGLNERAFQVVFQGNCTAEENTAVKMSNISYLAEDDIGKGYHVIAYDTASKTSITNDWTVATVWKVSRDLSKAILVDVVRDKLEFPDLLALFDDLDRLYKPNLCIIEDANSGIQLIQMRRCEMVLPSKVFKNLDDKFAMGEVLDMQLALKVVKFLSHIQTKTEIMDELNDFPFGNNDDVPLSMLHFIRWFMMEDAKEYIVNRSSTIPIKKLAEKVRKHNRRKTKSLSLNKPFGSAFR